MAPVRGAQVPSAPPTPRQRGSPPCPRSRLAKGARPATPWPAGWLPVAPGTTPRWPGPRARARSSEDHCRDLAAIQRFATDTRCEPCREQRGRLRQGACRARADASLPEVQRHVVQDHAEACQSAQPAQIFPGNRIEAPPHEHDRPENHRSQRKAQRRQLKRSVSGQCNVDADRRIGPAHDAEPGRRNDAGAATRRQATNAYFELEHGSASMMPDWDSAAPPEFRDAAAGLAIARRWKPPKLGASGRRATRR